MVKSQRDCICRRGVFLRGFVLIAGICGLFSGQNCDAADSGATWSAGVAKVEITPVEPVRLSGYGNRNRSSEGIDSPLFVRCLALKDSLGPVHLIVSVDTIGLPGDQTEAIAKAVRDKHGITRERFVLCNTHSHTAPDLVSELSNIFAVPMSDQEIAAGVRYRENLIEKVVMATGMALDNLNTAKIRYGKNEVGFAANRRVVNEARWTGFGVQADGPVDHSLPFLVVEKENGDKLAVVYNYACHCTTLTGDHYAVSGDWAGFASLELEKAFEGCVALCTIGCGADQNPEPRGNLALARQHGENLAKTIVADLSSDRNLVDLAPSLDSKFDYAALAFELPTIEEVRNNLEASDQPTRRLAERLDKTYRDEGRLPATYPVPIQSWQLGGLQMIFIGGEVVVDYALRLRQELKNEDLWVTAYANDVLGYIASERIRNEGGYEFDRSAVFYGLPGPWAAGSEDLLVEKILELVKRKSQAGPLLPKDALESFSIAPEWEVGLVASEPLVRDPINIAFGPDGKLWVAEMGDYPAGSENDSRTTNDLLPETMHGSGCIKALYDDDADGVMDRAEIFLDGIAFPTGVYPWRDGVLITAAPQIIFAYDRDSDGRCDEIRTLVDDIPLSNPQHRINGFTYGLDHSLHCAAGDNLGMVTVTSKNESIDANGGDLQLWPDSGEVRVVSGRSQYIRSRDDWGNWFGSENSLPFFQYVIDRRFAEASDTLPVDLTPQQVFSPAHAPPVFPLSQVHDRFNDLFAANRFTSACSSIILRSDGLGEELRGAVIVCEPVHNLVHLSKLIPNGASFQAIRPDVFAQSELLRSTDPWFRPVHAVVGPDDGLWIVDMYRQVIEHPEWIPQAWQQRLDVRAGDDRGRIYRITKRTTSSATTTATWKSIRKLEHEGLVGLLGHQNGPLRDMVQQELLQRSDRSLAADMKNLLANGNPFAKVHALSILQVSNALDAQDLFAALEQPDSGLILHATRLAGLHVNNVQVESRLIELLEHEDSSIVLAAVLALGGADSKKIGSRLLACANKSNTDRWVLEGIKIAAAKHWGTMLEASIENDLDDTTIEGEVEQAHRQQVYQILWRYWQQSEKVFTPEYLTRVTNAADRDSLLLALLSVHADKPLSLSDANLLAKLTLAYSSAATRVLDDDQSSEAERLRAIKIIRAVNLRADESKQSLLSVLDVRNSIQLQLDALSAMAECGGRDLSKAILERLGSISPEVRNACVIALTSRSEWADTLLDALERGDIFSKDIPPAAQFQLRSSGSRSKQTRADRIFNSTVQSNKQELIARYMTEMPPASAADIQLGRVAYEKNCAACHSADADGNMVGANLFNLSNYEDDSLLESILDPNRAVDPKYRANIVQLADGRTLSGVVQSENAGGLIMMFSDGKREFISRADIEGLKDSGVSLMPDNLHSILDPTAIRNILSYLKSQAAAKPAK